MISDDEDDECAMIKGHENAKRNDDYERMNDYDSVILQKMTKDKMNANEGISENDGRSIPSACLKLEGICENLNNNLFKEVLSREAGTSSEMSHVPLKPKQSAMIRQYLLGLQRGLDRALRIKGNDEMSENDNVFNETTLFNFYIYTLI